MNLNIIELTKTNETFSAQGQYFMRLEKEVTELRRLSRTQKRTNETIDHLWEIKEAEYGNINEILSSARNWIKDEWWIDINIVFILMNECLLV